MKIGLVEITLLLMVLQIIPFSFLGLVYAALLSIGLYALNVVCTWILNRLLKVNRKPSNDVERGVKDKA